MTVAPQQLQASLSAALFFLSQQREQHQLCQLTTSVDNCSHVCQFVSCVW